MFRRDKIIVLCGVIFLSSACTTPQKPSPILEFYETVQTLCGQSFSGRVISEDAVDEAWRQEALTLGPVTCDEAEMTRLALAVGSDQSRIWSLRLLDGGRALELKHTHTLKDGSPDPVTHYGGMARIETSSNTRAVFPVDDFSKDMFAANGLTASVINVWSLEINPGKTLIYELTRPGRQFTVEFDLTKPISN